MSFDLSVDHRGAYLFVTAVGSITEQGLVDLGHSIRRACEETGLRSVLLDCRHIRGALSPSTIYYATQRYVEAVGRAIRVAYINPPAHWTADEDQFSRDVAHNRGAALEVFETEDEAARWLAETEA